MVLVCRDRGRGAAAAAELAAAGGPVPRLEVADLASMGQVRTLAGRLGALERIDVLVNNAGLMAGQRRVTADGFDEVVAVNQLALFLLTNLLLGKLAAAGPARHCEADSNPWGADLRPGGPGERLPAVDARPGSRRVPLIRGSEYPSRQVSDQPGAARAPVCARAIRRHAQASPGPTATGRRQFPGQGPEEPSLPAAQSYHPSRGALLS